MFEDVTDKLDRMGRRRFLQALAGIGVSGAALPHLTADALADVDLDEEVPRLSKLEHTNHEAVMAGTEAPQREPEFYTISRDEWAVVETAHDAAATVTDRLAQAGHGRAVKAGVTTITRNQHERKAVVVKRTVQETPEGETLQPAASEATLRATLPDTVTGTVGEDGYEASIDDIPVVIETERVSLSGNNFEHEYRPVPGGCQLDNDANNSYYTGTAGTPAHNDDAGTVDLVTAGHVLAGDDGDTMHQPNNANHVGDRRDDKYDWDDASPGFDAGVIDLAPDDRYMFAGNGGDDDYRDDIHIFGIVGRDEIVDNENSYYPLEKQGVRTGVERGTLGDVYDVSFDTDAAEDDGDSGGPHIKKEYDQNFGIWRAYIAGIHYAGNGYDLSRATMMAEVEDRYDLTV